MKQVFEHYQKWECWHSGMYSSARPTLEGVNKCAHLLSNPNLFKETANRVLNEWRVSSQVHLSNPQINRQAYLGRACCCIECGANVETVRITWNLLPREVQTEANRVAQAVIDSFEINRTEQPKLFD